MQADTDMQAEYLPAYRTRRYELSTSLGRVSATKISDVQARVKEFNRKKHTTPRSRSLVAGAPATPATDTSKAAAKPVPVSSPVSASKLLPVPLARQVIKAMYLLY